MDIRQELLGKIDELIELVKQIPDPDGESDNGGVKVWPPLPELNNFAVHYGVLVSQLLGDDDPIDRTYYRCTLVNHLAPGENRGGHAVYVRVQDEYGNRITDPALRIFWTWEGRQPNQFAPPQKLDKADTSLEKGHGVVDLYKGMIVSLWIDNLDSSVVSDKAYGFRSDHPDELGPGGEIWNSIGHHSFLVVFQRVNP